MISRKPKASQKTSSTAQPKKKKKKAKALATPTIGIVHTGQFGGSKPEMCFLKGLSDEGWEKQTAPGKQKVNIKVQSAGKKYGGSFGHGEIRDKAKLHGDVDLIVAAGGLVSAEGSKSALTGKNIPFVYLVGRIPPGGISSPKCAGGVNLDMAARNPDRVAKLLQDFPVDEDGLYLVVNANAAMAGSEADDWRASQNDNVAEFFAGEDNKEAKFEDWVEVLGASDPLPTGVVVSSDPFFRLFRTDFTAALAQLGIPVCYPFKEFVEVAPAQSQKTCLDKPQLSVNNVADPDLADTGYYQLGRKAGQVLNQLRLNPGNPLPKVGAVSWDGNAWSADP